MIPIAALLAIGSLVTAPSRDFAEGQALYGAGQFARAAARFEPLCRNGRNAEACYWAGISYERLGDTRTPFGCPTYRKARVYFVEADELAPARYRVALFEFLLEYADCSRSVLHDAAALVAAVSEADPEYASMRSRLADASRRSGAPEERLGAFFLCLPRTGVRAAGLPRSLIATRRAAKSAGRSADRAKSYPRAPGEATCPASATR